MEPEHQEIIDSLSAEDIARRVPINKIVEAILLKVAVKPGFGWVYALVGLVKRFLVNVSELYQKMVHRNYNSNYHPDFKPYQVQILHPLQANRPKVIHAIANFATGGSAQLVVDLIEHLGHRYEQEVVVRNNPIPPSFIGQKIQVYSGLGHYRELLPYLKKFRPDIIHVHYWNWGDKVWYRHVFEAAQVYGCKIIENINVPVNPYISPDISQYVFVSDYVRQEYGHPARPALTIHPGSNLNLFSRTDLSSIPDDCIGMVYRLDHHKVDEHSIDVFVKVVQRRRQTKVLIVGGGFYLDHYKTVVQNAGLSNSFVFTGYVAYTQLPKHYAKLSIFVAPIVQESFGQVGPFAMSMGIPVVGYNVGALEEILGTAELLVPLGDSDALAELIIDLLDNREWRLRLGAINRQRAQDHFSVQTMINKYALLYEHLLQEQHSASFYDL